MLKAKIAGVDRESGTVESKRDVEVQSRPHSSSFKVSSLRSEYSRGTDRVSRDVDGAKVRGETPKPVSCLDAMPPGAYNRTGDNWRPLFAIAQRAGGGWLVLGVSTVRPSPIFLIFPDSSLIP